MRDVFITGALGFIGRTLATRLSEAGARVSGVDRVADPARDVIAGDISEPGAWQEAMRGADVVFHMAALVSNAASLDDAWRMNVMATRHALDAAARAGVGRFVHFSSIRAFSDRGFPDGVDEHHPVRTEGNPYVDTKVAAEQVVLQAHAAGEVAATIIRPGDVYGPGSRPWIVMPLELIKANRFVLPAMGRGIFSPVYVDNLLDGVMLATAAHEGSGQVFVLTDGHAVTCREFFGHLYRMLGRRGPICLPTPVAVSLAEGAWLAARARGRSTEANPSTMRYLARTGTYSIAKAERMLGYAPSVNLAEGMRRTERWLRAEGLL